MIIHIVKVGDTPYKIAQEYGVSFSRLLYDNQINLQQELVEGQALLILLPKTIHYVQSGDTLYGISVEYGVSIWQLLANNPYLLEQNTLFEGEYLVIEYINQPLREMNKSGYAYPFIVNSLLKETLLYINELLVFSYGFTIEGMLLPPINEEFLLIRAKEFRVKPILVLTPFGEDGRFNNYLVNRIVEDEIPQENLINQLLHTIQEKGYQGVDVDFEYILAEDRENYVNFIKNLRRTLEPEGYQVSVALAPKIANDQVGLLYEGIDYKGLGESANFVFLMTYEWGYKYGPPMAIAPLPQVKQVLDYAVSEIDRGKIILGIPNYGYDWPLPYERGITEAQTIGNVEAIQIALENHAVIQWDEKAKSPFFYYTQEKIEHIVWFEDIRSVQEKIKLAADYGINGVGYWNLMRPFRANWLLLKELAGARVLSL